MKKRFLLAVIPALMVLSSCAGVSQKVEIKDDNLFVEDTLAHEEIFGQSDLKLPSIRKLAPVDATGPAIAVQSARSGSGADEKISIRFVAAVKITGTLADATAVWTRTMYQSDGHIKEGKGEAEKPCVNAYTSIVDNGSPLTISAFNTAVGGGADYTHFVVYTMMNIPVAGDGNASDYYLKAYLTLSDGESVSSKVVATRVDQTTKLAYPLAKDKTGYFGLKKTAAGFETFDRDEHDGGNHARFFDININKDESFVLINSANDFFAVHGYDRLHDADNGDTNFDQDGVSQFAVAKATQANVFYLSNGSETNNFIYVGHLAHKTYYLNVDESWWFNDDARFAMVICEGGDNVANHHWYSMTKVSGTIYSCSVGYFNAENVDFIDFCRMKPDLANNWDNKWNDSGNQPWQATYNQYNVANDTHWTTYAG